MSTRLYLLLGLALGIAALLGFALLRPGQAPAMTAQAYRPQGPGDIYLALGELAATGFRLAEPERESYVALLAERLRPLGVDQHVNVAVAGATSGSLRERQLPAALTAIERARAEGLRVSPISLDIGGNDLRAVERATDAEREQAIAALAENLGAALDALRAAAPEADIVVMSYYDPYGGDPAIPGSDAAWIARLNTTIREAAEPRGVAVADVYGAFGGGKSYEYTNVVFGDIHANRQGHAVMAEQFWRALGYGEGRQE